MCTVLLGPSDRRAGVTQGNPLCVRRLVLSISTLAATSCASAPRNPALDKYPAGVEGRTTVTYYDVHGRTYPELRTEMRRLGPKINGGSFVGETRSPMTWSWRTESIAGGICTLRDVRVSVNAQILLPRWTAPADADSSLVAEWKRFIGALETHESGHKDISARAGRDLKDQLRGMSGTCSMMNMRANDIARQIVDRANAEQKQYDAETRHGLTQGTGFGAPSFVSANNSQSLGSGASSAGSLLPNSERLRMMQESRARADSAAERVTRLLVTPPSLELSVGDSVFSQDLYRRLEFGGVTAEGDTLHDFAKTFLFERNSLLERRGPYLVARGSGDVSLWVFLGSRPGTFDLRESARAVRVPIHIR